MEGIGTMAAIGGILLALVLGYVVFMQRKRTVVDVARSDAGARDLRAEIDADDKISDPDTKTF